MNEVMDRPATEEEVAAGRGDLQRDAGVMVEDMIQHVSSIRDRIGDAAGPQAERLRKETGRLLAQLESTRPGVVDMSCFLHRQPSAEDFKFPGRVNALIPGARRRMEKSKFMFPEPKSVVEAASVLVDEKDAPEARLRVAHYLAHMNMTQDGLAASAASRRLLQAASIASALAAGKELPEDQVNLMAAAKAALASFLYEARRRGRR
jgi:hypothetical protein